MFYLIVIAAIPDAKPLCTFAGIASGGLFQFLTRLREDFERALARLVVEDLRRHHQLVRAVVGGELGHPAPHHIRAAHYRA